MIPRAHPPPPYLPTPSLEPPPSRAPPQPQRGRRALGTRARVHGGGCAARSCDAKTKMASVRQCLNRHGGSQRHFAEHTPAPDQIATEPLGIGGAEQASLCAQQRLEHSVRRDRLFVEKVVRLAAAKPRRPLRLAGQRNAVGRRPFHQHRRPVAVIKHHPVLRLQHGRSKMLIYHTSFVQHKTAQLAPWKRSERQSQEGWRALTRKDCSEAWHSALRSSAIASRCCSAGS